MDEKIKSFIDDIDKLSEHLLKLADLDKAMVKILWPNNIYGVKSWDDPAKTYNHYVEKYKETQKLLPDPILFYHRLDNCNKMILCKKIYPNYHSHVTDFFQWICCTLSVYQINEILGEHHGPVWLNKNCIHFYFDLNDNDKNILIKDYYLYINSFVI